MIPIMKVIIPAARVSIRGRLASLRMNMKYVGPPRVRSAAKKINIPRMKPLVFFKFSRNVIVISPSAVSFC